MQAEKTTWLAKKAKMLAAFRPFKVRKTAIQKGILELMMGVEPITSSLLLHILIETAACSKESINVFIFVSNVLISIYHRLL